MLSRGVIVEHALSRVETTKKIIVLVVDLILAPSFFSADIPAAGCDG
jgi:hypothetical protein